MSETLTLRQAELPIYTDFGNNHIQPRMISGEFAVGEVREFATGAFESVEVAPGTYAAKMQTVQRMWDGNRWRESHEVGQFFANVLGA